MTYAEIVKQDVFPVSELVEHWNELQDLATGVEDPYVKADIAAEEEAIERFFEELGYGTVQEVAEDPNGETYQSTLIRANYFTDYFREGTEDAIPDDFPKDVYIDWEYSANEARQHEYTEADLPLDVKYPDGIQITFCMRAW